jgi:hypothetical protein
MCDGYELVKAPAKKITDTNSQSEINQSQHIQILGDLVDSTGANPKRAISSVKHAPELSNADGKGPPAPRLRRTGQMNGLPRIRKRMRKYSRRKNFAFSNSLVRPFDSAHEFLANGECR